MSVHSLDKKVYPVVVTRKNQRRVPHAVRRGGKCGWFKEVRV